MVRQEERLRDVSGDSLQVGIYAAAAILMPMRLAALVSGGKDSTYAIYRAIAEGHSVVTLVTVRPEREDSYMFHSANAHMTDLYSQACGIPLIVETSSGEKEAELLDLERALSRVEADVDGVVTGAVASVYQSSRVQKICDKLGLKVYSPLWKKEPEALLSGMAGLMDIVMVQVSAAGLDGSWLGRKLDASAIRDLKAIERRYRISIIGEGGEYETLVLDAPFFKHRIRIIKSKKEWMGDRGILRILEARLENK